VQILQDYPFYTKKVFHILFSPSLTLKSAFNIPLTSSHLHLELRRCCPLFASPSLSRRAGSVS
jgi:hypothetical protein